MARLKEYDRKAVLQKATTLFWEKGFETTSMGEMVRITGLNSASMYKEFGSKQGLYEAALTYYQETWLEKIIRALSDQPNLKGIESYISLLLETAGKADFKGCLMINTIAEKDVVSAAATAKVSKFCAHLESLLKAALQNAQKDGDINAGKDPAVLTNYIMCFMHGLVLYGRPDGNKKNVAGIIEMLMGAITT